jgi:hypothetical protein
VPKLGAIEQQGLVSRSFKGTIQEGRNLAKVATKASVSPQQASVLTIDTFLPAQPCRNPVFFWSSVFNF